MRFRSLSAELEWNYTRNQLLCRHTCIVYTVYSVYYSILNKFRQKKQIKLTQLKHAANLGRL